MRANIFLKRKKVPTNLLNVDVNNSKDMAFLKLANDSLKMALFLHHGVNQKFANEAVTYLLNN